MSRKIIAFVAIAVVLAALFVRLGFWQVHRLGERRARNTELRARLSESIATFHQLRDTSSFRRATVTGVPDFDNEIVYAGRSRNGSPGVYLLTPMRGAVSDTAVLVLRGWVYAPDAATVDVPRWREARSEYTGYVIALPSLSAAQRPKGRTVRTLDRATMQSLLPYPVASRYVVAQDSAGLEAPARLSGPALDDGPHLTYAIQWFSFAAIAIAGAMVVAVRDAAWRRVGATGAYGQKQ